MLVPSKFTKLEESTIFKMHTILADRQPGETVAQALIKTRDKFLDASEFLVAMDVLFLLGYLDIQDDTGVIEYA
ncbi:ABC-three component system middle component 7 [Pseudomonas argentinensis]|uniref:ABC-three component system middle component 7 n=1 Tax=Phytopseudomonas argentinensis TaxID=289370 RepID=UPI0008A99339